jgi:predicted Co/Zn/Cd cation transporter (cation efflux family)
MLRRINLSAAIIVLVCFFLPWVQVSCAGSQDTLSGLGLARQDDVLLWLIPLAMCAALIFVLLRVRPARPQLLGVLSTICGVIVIFLMNRERTRAYDSSGLIAAQLTGWFWLGFIAAFAVVGTGVAILLRKPKAPGI